MNYTEKYHLPQWEETDRIMRVDFNQMCADVEAGMTANKKAAAKAQATADAAQETAEQFPYVVGTYTGDGSTGWREFNLGFQPKVVIITHQHTVNTYDNTANDTLVMSATNPSLAWKLTEKGFAVSGYNQNVYPWINSVSAQYTYIAFR